VVVSPAAIFLTAILLTSCTRDASEREPAPSASPTIAASGWLHGDVDARFHLVEKHLRGFDVAMVETGYRYGELYWAGEDQNWDYARYQLDKIQTAVNNGVERRPLRGASAKMLVDPVAAVRSAIDSADPKAFAAAFSALTNVCNACHQVEKVAFITVAEPTERLSPVRPVEKMEREHE
jgi:hypothetical protein